MKTQLVVNKTTKEIICINTCNGKTHDFKLFKDSKLPINPKVTVVTDSGYQGLKDLHLKSELPIKRSKSKPLTVENKQENTKLASKRVFNEHVNCIIKVFS